MPNKYLQFVNKTIGSSKEKNPKELRQDTKISGVYE